MKKHTIAILGLAHWYWAYPIAGSASVMPNVNLKWIVGEEEEQTRKTAALMKVEHWSLDYMAALNDPEVDIVVITSTTDRYEEMAVAAAEHKKHILISKPVSQTLAGADHIMRAVQENQVKLIGYGTVMEKLRSILRRDKLHQPIAFEKISHYALRAQGDTGIGYGTRSWRRDPQFPLGALFDGGVHEIAMITSLFGEPERVFASGMTYTPLEKERVAQYSYGGRYDHILTTYAYTNGFTGIHSYSAALENGCDKFNIYFVDGSIQVSEGQVVVCSGGWVETVNLAPDDAHRCMWSDLAAAYREKTEPLFTVQDAIAGLRILDAIQKSLSEQVSVTLK